MIINIGWLKCDPPYSLKTLSSVQYRRHALGSTRSGMAMDVSDAPAGSLFRVEARLWARRSPAQ